VPCQGRQGTPPATNAVPRPGGVSSFFSLHMSRGGGFGWV
jgi:hypothetical protein